MENYEKRRGIFKAFSENIRDVCGPFKEYVFRGDIELEMIKTNALSYSAKFINLTQRRSKKGWNWAAFIFTPLWFVYRKMYIECVIVYVASVLLPWVFTIVSYGSMSGIVNFLWSLALSVFVGVIGDYYYMIRTGNECEFAGKLEGKRRSRYIKRVSGTSKVAPVIVAGIGLALELYIRIKIFGGF